jgi:hypothetical protein
MKVPRQCPLALLLKVGWRGGKTFGCEEGIDQGWANFFVGGPNEKKVKCQVGQLNLL